MVELPIREIISCLVLNVCLRGLDILKGHSMRQKGSTLMVIV